jgi:phage gpG-like protein
MAQQGSAELRKVVAKLRKLGTEARRDVATVLATQTVQLIARGFNRSQAPDGTPWKEITHRKGQPLIDSERLRGGWGQDHATVTPSGFSILNNTPYAEYHQSGTKRITARPMVPTDSLPASWDKAFTAAATLAIKKILGG